MVFGRYEWFATVILSLVWFGIDDWLITLTARVPEARGRPDFVVFGGNKWIAAMIFQCLILMMDSFFLTARVPEARGGGACGGHGGAG